MYIHIIYTYSFCIPQNLYLSQRLVGTILCILLETLWFLLLCTGLWPTVSYTLLWGSYRGSFFFFHKYIRKYILAWGKVQLTIHGWVYFLTVFHPLSILMSMLFGFFWLLIILESILKTVNTNPATLFYKTLTVVTPSFFLVIFRINSSISFKSLHFDWWWTFMATLK